MRYLKQGICLAVIGAGLSAVPALTNNAVAGVAAADPAAAAGSTLVQQMRDGARGTVRVAVESATGKAGFVRTTAGGDLLPGVKGDSAQAAVAKARAYLDKYAGVFGATSAQLQQIKVDRAVAGTTVTYTQRYQGLDVFGTMLHAHVDTEGDLTSVNGFASPVSDLSTAARQSPAQAGARAVAFVKSSPTDAAAGSVARGAGLKVTHNDLVVYRTGAIKHDTGKNLLAYAVEVGDGHAVREKVFVDAQSGKVVNRYSMVDNALDRELREAFVDDNGTPADEDDDFVGFETVWTEGQTLDGLNDDQKNLVLSSGESYWFFKNAFGRDSYDDSGAKRITVNNDPRISCPNANWNGQTTNYCDGVTSDDVVAHEWGHANTEYTWGGIYQWQSGALNESYSDIYGETLDLINRREDEGEGDLTGKRPVGLCSTHSAPNPLLTITAPADLAKVCVTGGYLGPDVLVPISGNVVAPTDAVEDGGTNLDGCSPYNEDVTGKIVIVNRGLCTFVAKAVNAKAEGAAAVIIGNRDAGPVSFSSDDDTLPTTVSIGIADRDAIRAKLAGGSPVTVSITDGSGTRFDSYRWLIGEKSTAFGGAIRDMWVPTCYGDPGKVSDVEYACSTDDQGGVHGNSGVPNHGYALLVDGGTYNGTAVKGIGLTKAMAIYYRAATSYMTPVSDFGDHADSLAGACSDLVGKQIRQLSTQTNDVTAFQGSITADDCAQVDKMATAVELRKDPVQCDFKPQLNPNSLATCGAGFGTKTAFTEDFEDGLTGWVRTGTSVFGGPTRDWESNTDLPEGNKPANDTTAAFGPTPDFGQCTGDTQDFSSVNYLTSPPIVVGTAGEQNPRLTFDHNIQTELGFDGGTVQIARNGGAFATVPAAAYLFNGPTVLATEAAGNTDPLAGQPGFTGTDGGRIVSDWGTSIVDLAAAGVNPGDTILLRYAVGRDGCGGVNGWWVDNIQVAICEKLATSGVTAALKSTPVRFGTPATVSVDVSGSGTPGPTGQAVVKEGAKTLGTAALSGGKASVKLPATLAVGKHSLTVSYTGDGNFAGATTPLTVTVAKALAKVVVKPRSYSVKAGKPIVLTSTVSAVGVTPTGEITVRSGGKVVGTGTLKAGKVTITIPGGPGKGKRAFYVSYPGSATVGATAKSISIKVS